MISQCPHCRQALQLTPAQQEKIDTALANLKSGATLKVGCPNCRQPISLKADGSLLEEGAVATAPTPPPVAPASPSAAPEPPAAPEIPEVPAPAAPPQPPWQPTVTPPSYPDISWLAQGIYTEQAVMTEVPKALVLMASGKDQAHVAKALTERGYQTEFPESASDALVKMRFGLYTAVVLHDEFDGPLAESTFHQQMSAMPMDKRRSIFYVLIGKQMHTLYNLQALALSANVVVNETECDHFDIILKKGLQEMEELFGPYALAIKRMTAV